VRRAWRLGAIGVQVAAALTVAAVPVLACEGAGITLNEAASSSVMIVRADVLGEPRNSLNFTLRVREVVRGNVAAGQTITIGPRSNPPATYPDCWLDLPDGHQVVLALTSTTNLDALTSYAWWVESSGQLVSASRVTDSPATIEELLTRLRASPAMPPTDTVEAAEKREGQPVLPLVFAAGLGASWLLVSRAARVRRDGSPHHDQAALADPIGSTVLSAIVERITTKHA
jgi:hypothetical protein